MIMYAQLAGQDKSKGVLSIIFSYDVEADAQEHGMTVDDYLRRTLELNPQFERVYCR